jgi:DNA-binding Xre family transcriptional regulator
METLKFYVNSEKNFISMKAFNTLNNISKKPKVTFNIHTHICILLKYKIYNILKKYIFYKSV